MCCAFRLFDAAWGAVAPCSGVDRSSLPTWRQGAKMPWTKCLGTLLLALGSGCRGASVCLPAVLSTQGRWVVALQFPPFLPAVGNFSPPRLLRKLLSLSPQVIFHHVALKSWALLGEGRGGTGPINPFLPVEGRPGDLFDEWERSTIPRVASEHWHTVAEPFFGRRIGK